MEIDLFSVCISMCTGMLSHFSHVPTRHHCQWDFPCKDTGMGCHALLQGIFLTQGSNQHLMSPASLCFTTSTTWESHISLLEAITVLFSHLLWQVDSLPLVPPRKPLGFPYHFPICFMAFILNFAL